MTNEDIIKTLRQLEYPYPTCEEQEKVNEALLLAIKAVKQMDSCPVFSDDDVKQPCVESPCAIKALENEPKKGEANERPQGEWKVKGRDVSNTTWHVFCSNCNCDMFIEFTSYCPNCGADMREADND